MLCFRSFCGAAVFEGVISHPAPVVIPSDLEVFLFRLFSPFEADHDRVGDFRLVQVLRVVHKRHHHERRFVGVPRHAIVVRHHMKVNHCVRLRRPDEWNGLESQGYVAEAFEVDRGDFEVLGGITAQMVQRKDITLPLVGVALDCRQHDPWPVPTGLRCRLLRHELGFGSVACCRAAGFVLSDGGTWRMLKGPLELRMAYGLCAA